MNASRIALVDLMSLEQYARQREQFRARVMEHKKHRRLQIGPNATWLFEDRLMIQYQIQEMLRAERIFEPAAIEEELSAYNPLIPDGTNWKATFLIEYSDEGERRSALKQLLDIEDRCWVQVKGHERVYAIADEDLDRENDEKTSSVHFLRFEFDGPMRAALKAGVEVSAGIDHPNYLYAVRPLPPDVRRALVADLE